MRNYFVTGSCGFIGNALCKKLLKNNNNLVIGIDNLSRVGSKNNLKQLVKYKNFIFFNLDIKNYSSLEKIFSKYKPDILCHLAAQVAVTLSYQDPIRDFNTNALGTVNLLSLVQKYNKNCFCLYSSSNKVYGKSTFKDPVDISVIENPHTPYGVSKFVGDLYFKEFASEELGLKTCVLKQSCIYGPGQYGIEDQGWLMWFLLKNYFKGNLKIFGSGRQVRDLLFIDDLIDLYIILINKKIVGSYPLGGGISNSLSLNKSINLIEKVTKNKFRKITYSNFRPGDQHFFVSDNSWLRKFKINWIPKITPSVGIKEMHSWISINHKILNKIYGKKL